MRAKIDITEVEQATKIRAKYLRALENEEWNLLPGSTFVKSFLREYADHLGLDSRLLVEEYKLRYERPSEQELASISPNLGRDRPGPVAPRWAIVASVIVALLVALWAVGTLVGGGEDAGEPAGATSGDGQGGTTST
ncbi:MAG: helix-turn-helix domain-containing protein, partial [Conexibacter sp.]